nr:MAG TPA: hypothetical protein [Caudoviricetes sp.]
MALWTGRLRLRGLRGNHCFMNNLRHGGANPVRQLTGRGMRKAILRESCCKRSTNGRYSSGGQSTEIEGVSCRDGCSQSYQAGNNTAGQGVNGVGITPVERLVFDELADSIADGIVNLGIIILRQ